MDLFAEENKRKIEFPVIIKFKNTKGVLVYYENQTCLMIETTSSGATYCVNRNSVSDNFEEYINSIERMIQIHGLGSEDDYKVAAELFEDLKNTFLNAEFSQRFNQTDIEEMGKIKYRSLDGTGRF